MTDGGSFVNSGTYGCVFKPPVKCQRKKTSSIILNAAGKIFPDEHSFKEEYAELKKVRKLDPKHLFTVPYLGHCKVNAKDFKPTDETDKCLRHISPTRRIYNQLIYQYGGIDLSEYYKFPAKHFIYFEDFVQLFVPLLEGLRLMGTKKVAHVDIKPENMLIDTTLPKIYLIDFGLSTPFNLLKYETNFHDHEYPYYPPEFKLLSAYRAGAPIQPDAVYATFMRNFRFYNQAKFIAWMEKRWPTYSKEAAAFIQSFATRSQADMTLQFDRVFVEKLDSYSLAMTLIEIIFRLESSKNLSFKTPGGANFLEKLLSQCLFPMVRPDAYQRMSITEAIPVLNGLLFPPAPSRIPSPTPKTHPAPVPPKTTPVNLPPVVPGLPPVVSPTLQAKLPKSYTDCAKMKGKDIQALLKQLKLPAYGTKDVLCRRLMNHIVSVGVPVSASLAAP